MLTTDIDNYKSKQLSDYAASLPFTPPDLTPFTPPIPPMPMPVASDAADRSAPAPLNVVYTPGTPPDVQAAAQQALGPHQGPSDAAPTDPSSASSLPPTPTAPLVAPPGTTQQPGPIGNPPPNGDFNSALDWGKQQINKPYIWGSTGGRTDMSGTAPGYDCSGFVSQFYHQMGRSVPAQTVSAYNATTHLDPKDAQPGDIVEWMDPNHDATQEHMAIYLGDGKIMQSGGSAHKVNIGDVNQFGPGTYEFRRAAGGSSSASDSKATSQVASAAGTTGSTSGSQSLSDPPNASSQSTPTAQPFDPMAYANSLLSDAGNAVGNAASGVGSAAHDVWQGVQHYADSLPFTPPDTNDPFGSNSPLAPINQRVTQRLDQGGLNPGDITAIPGDVGGKVADAIYSASPGTAQAARDTGTDPLAMFRPNASMSSDVLTNPLQNSGGLPSASDLNPAGIPVAIGAVGSMMQPPGGEGEGLAGDAAQAAKKVAPLALDELGRVIPAAEDVAKAAGGALAGSAHPALAGFDLAGYAPDVQRALTNFVNTIKDPQVARDTVANFVKDNHPAQTTFTGTANAARDIQASAPLADAVAAPVDNAVTKAAVSTPASSTIAPAYTPLAGETEQQAFDRALAEHRAQRASAPAETVDLVTGAATPPVEPPSPPTTDGTSPTPPPEPTGGATDMRGAAANYQQPNLLQRGVNTVKDFVAGSASNAPEAVQQAVKNFDTTTSMARINADRAAAQGMARNVADQQAAQDIGKAKAQFQSDILQSQQGVELKSVLTQHASIDSGGQNLVGNPMPKGWVDGADLPGAGLGHVWVSPEVANVVKSVLQHDPTPVLSGTAWLSGQAKQFVLNSPFHALYEGAQAANVGLGATADSLVHGDLRGAAQALGNTADMFTRSTVAGIDLSGAVFKKIIAQPDTQQWIDRMVAGGGTWRPGVGEAVDLASDTAGGSLAQAANVAGVNKLSIGRGVVGGAVSGGTTYLNDKAQGVPEDQARQDALTHAAEGFLMTGPGGTVLGKAIFERQIPLLKVGAFKLLVQHGVADETAGAMVNQTFGGINLVRMARSRAAQDIMRSAALAPDLWEGITRNLLSAIPGAPVSMQMGNTARQYVGTAAALSAIMLESANLLSTGHLTTATPAMHVGGINIPASAGNEAGHELDLEVPHTTVAKIPGAPAGTAGQMDHIDILSQVKTIANAIGTATDPTAPLQGRAWKPDPSDAAGTFATGRTSTPLSTGLDLVQNKNPANQKVPIVPPGESELGKAGDIAGFAAGRLMPIGASGADQGAKAAGPLGALAEYATGKRITTETPADKANKAYYAVRDDAVKSMTDWLVKQPEYTSATPAAQKSLLLTKTIELEKYLREKNSVAPQNKGMPAKYIGVSDPRTQILVDEAKARLAAFKADPIHSQRPTPKDYILGAHPLNPSYLAAQKSQTATGKGLDQRFQQTFTAPGR